MRPPIQCAKCKVCKKCLYKTTSSICPGATLLVNTCYSTQIQLAKPLQLVRYGHKQPKDAVTERMLVFGLWLRTMLPFVVLY